jgi:diadenylate cyclase
MGEVFREALNTVWSTLKTFEFKDAVDILIVALLLYYLFRLFRQSRSGQLVKGVVILLIMFAISAIANLTMVRFILKSVFEFFVIILVVVFQPELRQGLERLGRSNMTLRNFMNSNSQSPETFVMKAISDVADSCAIFSKSRTGALIVFERNSLLNEIAGTGTTLNSETSPALIGNIFFPNSPLHDGAAIVRDAKLYAAGCVLPLTDNPDISSELGMRHRAAIGVTEQSDAVAIITSEETGTISICYKGNIERGFDEASLRTRLFEFFEVDKTGQENTKGIHKIKKIFKGNK